MSAEESASLARPATVRPRSSRLVHPADSIGRADENVDTRILPDGWAGPPGHVWGQAPAAHPQLTRPRVRPRARSSWLSAVVLGLGSIGAFIGTVAALSIGGLTAMLLIASSLSVMAAGVVVASGQRSGLASQQYRGRTTAVVVKQESEEIR